MSEEPVLKRSRLVRVYIFFFALHMQELVPNVKCVVCYVLLLFLIRAFYWLKYRKLITRLKSITFEQQSLMMKDTVVTRSVFAKPN